MQQGIPRFQPHIVIDTGRNGGATEDKVCGEWCNPRWAGLGLMSTATTRTPSIVDPYFWLKAPGESDGCTAVLPNGSKCNRFDASCNSSSSLGTRPGEPKAPEAGMWYDFEMQQMA